MSERFDNLKKIPEQPARRFLAAANAKLKTELTTPANASVSVVLTELEQQSAWVDMIRLISVSLPSRECVWWACIAGRDVIGDKDPTPCLNASEAWVFEPNDDNRAKVQAALETGEVGDHTRLCATAALYAPGNLGPGELKDMEAPPGVVSASAFGINLKTLKTADDIDAQFQLIIDRGLDIARGGNGRIEKATPDGAPEKEKEES